MPKNKAKIYIPITNYFHFRTALQFYRGKTYDISNEFDEIQERHLSKTENNDVTTWKQIFSLKFLKPFSCIGILNIFHTMSGPNVVMIFLILILDQEESGSFIDPNKVPIIIGSLSLIVASKKIFQGSVSQH